jgi:DNA-binding HxlR family transcriptional regulator
MKKNTAKSFVVPLEDAAAVRDEVRRALALIAGKWKLEILWLLNQRMYRFNEMRRALPGVTQHMLTAQLRELEADGFVQRTIYAEVPPRVEYRITDEALSLKPVFEVIIRWASARQKARQRSSAENIPRSGSPGRGRLTGDPAP